MKRSPWLAAFVPAASLAVTTVAQAATLQTLVAFTGSPDGYAPNGGPVALNGMLYGTTFYGGAQGGGMVYEIDPASGAEKILYSFEPNTSGFWPSQLTVFGSALFGFTDAGIFRIDPSSGSESILYTFPGVSPYDAGPLVLYNSNLYGILTGDMVCSIVGQSSQSIFRFNPSTGVFSTIANLPCISQDSQNYGLLASFGNLYMTTSYGGTNGEGQILSIDPATGSVQSVYSFPQDSPLYFGSPLSEAGEYLYGIAAGSIYKFDPASASLSIVSQFRDQPGFFPTFKLVASGGNLFGAASSGGTDGAINGGGYLFRIDPATGNQTIAYRFGRGVDGSQPLSNSLLKLEGTLYGTSLSGGLLNRGTVFSYNVSTGRETVLHSYAGPGVPEGGYTGLPHEDVQPEAGSAGVSNSFGIVIAVLGEGGSNVAGALLKIDPGTEAATTIANFPSPGRGYWPNSPFVNTTSGLLYGTVRHGAANGFGGIVRVNPSNGAIKLLYSFKGGSTDGANPVVGMTNVGGVLWGTTKFGSNKNAGTIFRFDPATGIEKLVHNFSNSLDYLQPAPMIEFKGFLYGTTASFIFQLNPATGELVLTPIGGNSSGGLAVFGGRLYGVRFANRRAEIFAYNPANSHVDPEQVLRPDPGGFVGNLIIFNGLLYGAVGPTDDSASYIFNLFSFDPYTHALTTLYSFDSDADGYNPTAGLVVAGGALYGATTAGGAGGLGTVFRLTP